MSTGLRCLLTATPSDAHTWGLVALELLLTELGHEVTNLGPCPPEDLVVEACRRTRPDVLVLSTTNGHGHLEAPPLIRRVRECREQPSPWAAIGGKLDCGDGSTATAEELRAAGFDAVFPESEGLDPFVAWIGGLGHVGRSPLVPVV